MRKAFTAALAALSLAAGMAASTTADAQSRYRRDRDDTGVAIAAGVAGLALGAAIANGGPRYGYRGYPRGYGYGYGYGYAPPAYGYRYAPPFYGPRYYAPVRPRARVCTFWRHDSWGRSYPVQRWC